MEDSTEWIPIIRKEANARDWNIITQGDDYITLVSPNECELYPKYKKKKVTFVQWPSNTGMTAIITQRLKYGESSRNVRCYNLDDVRNVFTLATRLRDIKINPLRKLMYNIKKKFDL